MADIWTIPVSRIGISDVQALLQIPVAENLYVEYKRQINLESEQAKSELLADVSSFANSRGGIILFGVVEECGIPKEICGVISQNLDGLILTVRQILESSLQPKIPHLDIGIVSIDGKSILAVRIPSSIIGPHIVQYQGSIKFFIRAVAGKRPMDWMEMRDAFVQADRRKQQLAALRKQRIDDLKNGGEFSPLKTGAKLIIHIFPHSPATRARVLESRKWEEEAIGLLRVPIWAHQISQSDIKITFDGLVSKYYDTGYLQITWDGFLEAVALVAVDDNSIPMHALEKQLVDTLGRYRKLLHNVEAGGPFSVYLTLVDVKGMRYRFPNQFADLTPPLDRNTYAFDGISIDLETNLDEALSEIFDQMWNACGYASSPNRNKVVRA